VILNGCQAETVVGLPWAADSCPWVGKLRTVLPATVGIRDGVVQLVLTNQRVRTCNGEPLCTCRCVRVVFTAGVGQYILCCVNLCTAVGGEATCHRRSGGRRAVPSRRYLDSRCRSAERMRMPFIP
jgi:hypothetical protein